MKRQIESLSEDRLRAAADFVDELVEREPNAATRELIEIPNLVKDIQAAEKQDAEPAGATAGKDDDVIDAEFEEKS